MAIKTDKNKTWKIQNTFYWGVILIIIGISIRVYMLIFYYIVHLNPNYSWGDVAVNYHTIDSIFTGEWIWSPTQLEYPPLSLYLLIFFKFIAFDIFELFVFYAFLLELLISLFFYFVLKRFDIPKRTLTLGMFLVDPFVFLNNVFSPINCGYHITDSFFYIFLMLSLYYYPKEDKSFFYLFSGLTMSAKWFTLPAALYFFLKFLLERNWNQLKKVVIFIGIPIIIFLVSPLLYLPNYINLYMGWLSGSAVTGSFDVPIYFKLIIIISLFASYFLVRIKKADLLEITFFSIIVMFSVMFWRRPYVRYLTPLVLYGHLKTYEEILSIKVDIKIFQVNIRVGNHLLTYAFSILGCLVAIAIIIFIF